MAETLLSICIPTYNFGKFLGETLDSIIPNLRDGVEVVVLDGGSTDDTADVVSTRQQRYPQIRFHRQEFRGGIDRDIATVVGLGRGKYCWLFSADDIMKADAVEKVVSRMGSGAEIYLCEQTLCDFEMRPLGEYPVFNGIHAPEVFHLGNERERLRYFSHARTSEAFFSFLSGPIFKREIWERAQGIPDSFYGTCWALAGRLLSLVRDGLVIEYLAESLIYKRGGNDSFMEHGVVERLRITVEGYGHIAETIFGKDSWEYQHVRRVLRFERRLPHLLGLKLTVATTSQRGNLAALNKLVDSHYANVGMLNRCKYAVFRAMPIPALQLGSAVRTRIKKMFRRRPAEPIR